MNTLKDALSLGSFLTLLKLKSSPAEGSSRLSQLPALQVRSHLGWLQWSWPGSRCLQMVRQRVGSSRHQDPLPSCFRSTSAHLRWRAERLSCALGSSCKAHVVPGAAEPHQRGRPGWTPTTGPGSQRPAKEPDAAIEKLFHNLETLVP